MKNEDAQYHLSKAKSHFEKNDFKNAIIEFQQALAIEPGEKGSDTFLGSDSGKVNLLCYILHRTRVR